MWVKTLKLLGNPLFYNVLSVIRIFVQVDLGKCKPVYARYVANQTSYQLIKNKTLTIDCRL